MKKMILTLLATAFLMTGAYHLSKPASAGTLPGEDQNVEEVCRDNLKFENFVKALNEDGVKVRPLTEPELTYLIKTKGEPPVAPPYSINIAETEDNSMLVIVQNGCIVGKLGPLPTFIMQGLLGSTPATDQQVN